MGQMWRVALAAQSFPWTGLGWRGWKKRALRLQGPNRHRIGARRVHTCTGTCVCVWRWVCVSRGHRSVPMCVGSA